MHIIRHPNNSISMQNKSILAQNKSMHLINLYHKISNPTNLLILN